MNTSGCSMARRWDTKKATRRGRRTAPRIMTLKPPVLLLLRKGSKPAKQTCSQLPKWVSSPAHHQWYHLPPKHLLHPLSMLARKHLLPWTHHLWFCQFHVSIGPRMQPRFPLHPYSPLLLFLANTLLVIFQVFVPLG